MNILIAPSLDIEIEKRDEIIAATDSQIKTQRLSYLSANHPTGYCASAPPKTKADKK